VIELLVVTCLYVYSYFFQIPAVLSTADRQRNRGQMMMGDGHGSDGEHSKLTEQRSKSLTLGQI